MGTLEKDRQRINRQENILGWVMWLVMAFVAMITYIVVLVLSILKH